MQRSHILVLDSRDRINKQITESNSCTLRIEPAIGGFDKIELLSFSVPNIQYNIDNSNNKVYFTDGVTDWTATLTSAAYNYITLPIALKDVMDTISGLTFTVTYDESTFKITIAVSSGTFGFTFGTNTTDSAAAVLGFFEADTALAASHTSDNSLNLSLPPYFYIYSPELGRHVSSSGRDDFGTWIVPNPGNSGDIVNFTMFSQYQLLESFQHTSLSSVSFMLKNRGGELLDVRGTDWVIILKLHYPSTQFI